VVDTLSNELSEVGRCRLTVSKPVLSSRDKVQRVKLQYDETLSNFAFYSNLRRYTEPQVREAVQQLVIDGDLYSPNGCSCGHHFRCAQFDVDDEKDYDHDEKDDEDEDNVEDDDGDASIDATD